MTTRTMTTPKARYHIGDRVTVYPQEAGCPPFEAVVCGIRIEHDRIGGSIVFRTPDYTLLEDGSYTSDGWTEDMFSPLS